MNTKNNLNKVIITGGAGFIGSNLVKKLLENGTEKILIIDDKIGEGTGSTIYKQGDWYDLCLGPHVASTAKLMFCKLE